MLLQALEREAAAFTAVLEVADLSTPVAACPGWDLTELSAHLAGTHRWSRQAVADGVMGREPTPALADRSAVVAWYASSAAELLDTLRAAPDDAPCPTFLSPQGTARFWLRRQVHELAVHRYDAESAAGRQPVLDSELCADGIGEVLEVFLPRMRARGLLGDLPASVLLRLTDGTQSWALGDGSPVASVTADACDLLLLLWKRRDLEGSGVRVQGDAKAAAAVLASALTP